MAASVFVAFGASATSPATTTLETASQTLGGANRVLYVMAGAGAGTPTEPTAVKCGGSGGTSLTKIADQDIGANVKASIWRLISPPTGSQTIHVTWPSAMDERWIVAIQVQDASLSNPNALPTESFGNNAQPIVSVPGTTNGEMVLGLMSWLDSGCSSRTVAPAGSGHTSLVELEGVTLVCEGATGSRRTSTGGTFQLQWDVDGGSSVEWGFFAFQVNPEDVVTAVASRRKRSADNHPGRGPKNKGKFFKTKARLGYREGDIIELTGAQGDSATGTVVSNVNYTLSGVQASGQTGSITTNISDTAAPVGSMRQRKRPHPGRGPLNIGKRHTAPRHQGLNNTFAALSGVEGTTAEGVVTNVVSFQLSGVQGQGQVNSVGSAQRPAEGSRTRLSTHHPGYGPYNLGKFYKNRRLPSQPAGDLPGGDAALTGAQGTGQVGTLRAEISEALTGVFATAAVGDVGDVPSFTLDSLLATTVTGTATSDISYAITGVQATGAVGDVQPLTGEVLAITGVQALGLLQGAVSNVTYALLGVQGVGSTGSVSTATAPPAPPPAPPAGPRQPRPGEVTTRTYLWLDMVQRAWGPQLYAPDKAVYRFSNGRTFDSSDIGRTGLYGVDVPNFILADDNYPDMRTEILSDPDDQEIAGEDE